MTLQPVWGIDRFLAESPAKYGRTGWFANGAAVTGSTLTWGPLAALEAGFGVTQLFGPEHGPHGAVSAGTRIESHREPWTGLPVCSLYGEGPVDLAPAVAACETVVVDVVELGARYSTNLALAADLLDAVARYNPGGRVVVLDRPNPLGRTVEGPGLAPQVRSIVGRLDIPPRHGLTLGELMRWYTRTSGLDLDLWVVPAEGFDPGPVSVATRPYLPPSPNLNTIEAQLLYTGTCLLEGTNLSEGRGTASPFQMFGAPWLDARALAADLRADGWEGVVPRPVHFVPMASKHAGTTCEGVYLHVVDHDKVRPVGLAVRALSLVFARHQEAEILQPQREDQVHCFMDLLWGSPELARCLGSRSQTPDFARPAHFADQVLPDLLYRPPPGPA